MKRSNRKGHNRRRRKNRPAGKPSGDEPTPGGGSQSSAQASRQDELPRWIVGSVFVWAYWPTLVGLVRAWDSNPDYSHGFFVAPLAVLFLWIRRDSYPGAAGRLAWPGLALIALGVAARMLGASAYVKAVDGWSIMLWVAGVVWLLGGWRGVWGSSPSIAFLWFLVPLPYRIELWARQPLQRVATVMSSWTLQLLGLPAVAEANTIVINDARLEVEDACSGLRIFVGIVALAFAYIIIVRRAWWEKALLLVSALPIALIANSTRIVATGLLQHYVSGEAAHKFTHDIAGYVMIPLAAGLFALVLWYLGKLTGGAEVTDSQAAAHQEST